MGGISYRKAIKRLKRRQAAYDAHGTNPQANPGKAHGGTPHQMHRPGSMQGK